MHTPGPWEVDPDTGEIVAQDRVAIGVVYGADGDLDLENRREGNANAALIVAAPDLLAACKAFFEARDKSHQLEKTDVAQREMLKAIEKAEEKTK